MSIIRQMVMGLIQNHFMTIKNTILRGKVMENKLDLYDKNKLKEARNLVRQVYEYNFKSRYDYLSSKLETILKKIDNLIEDDE